MLTLKPKSFPLTISTLHLRNPLFTPSRPFISFPIRSSSSSSTSTMDPITATTIEHVVLFKVRDGTDPSKISTMLTSLRSLCSLPFVSHLSTGPILRLRSSAASSLSPTHLLHSRYPSLSDLSSYSSHPSHLSAVKDNILPIVDDITAVDWISHNQLLLPPPPPGSALRLTLAKPKEGVETKDVIAAIGTVVKTEEGKVEQVSFGENFSPARAKGYTVGFVSVFKSVEELDGLVVEEAEKEKVRGLVDDVVVLDYVVPDAAAKTASL